jgi:hypothetical protein
MGSVRANAPTGKEARVGALACLVLAYPQNPFRYFKTSPEVIRLAVLLYVRRRERAMLRFRRMACLQKFASVHANVHNHFNSERHLVDRSTFKQRRSAALAEWQSLFS